MVTELKKRIIHHTFATEEEYRLRSERLFKGFVRLLTASLFLVALNFALPDEYGGLILFVECALWIAAIYLTGKKHKGES